MALDELAVTIGKRGAGDWELRLDSGETIDATLDEVEVGEERGFHAEGRSEEREMLYELTTGPQPGGRSASDGGRCGARSGRRSGRSPTR